MGEQGSWGPVLSMIYHSAWASSSLSLFFLAVRLVRIWAFGLLHYGSGMSPGRMPGSGSGGVEESCVELYVARDYAHYPLVLGKVCSYLLIMPKISTNGGEDVGLR